MKRPLMIALAACLGLGSAAGAKPSTVPPAAPRPGLTIPFAPVIGKVLRLHSQRLATDLRGAVEVRREETTAEDELVFTERNPQGYVLRWTTRSIDLKTSPDRQAIVQKIMSAIVDKPVLIQTSPNGVPVAILNMAEMRALLVAAFDAMGAAIDTQFAAQPASARDAVRKMIAGMAGMYRDMTDTQLNALFLDEAQRLFGYGGVAFEPGRPVPYVTKVTLPLAGTPMEVAGHYELREATPRELTIGASAALNPADVKAATDAYLEQALAGLDPAQHDAIRAGVAKLEGFRSTENLILTLDAHDGIVRRATYRKQTGVGDQSRTETKTYTLTE